MDLLYLYDVCLSVECESLLLQRRFSRIRGIEYVVEFFQSAIFSFWDEEVDDCGLDRTPQGKQDVCLPCHLLKCDWVGELVDKSCYEECISNTTARIRKQNAYQH